MQSGLVMRFVTVGVSMLLFLGLLGGSAGAQTPEETRAAGRPRARLMEAGYLNLNAAYSNEDRSSTRQLSLPLYDETAVFDVGRASSPRVGLDAAAGLRVWSNLSVGLGVTYSLAPTDVDLTGAVPHPLFYGRDREAQYSAEGFERTELGMHLHAAWTIRVSDRVDLALSAGPSLIRVEQGSVSGIDSSETGPPYDQVEVEVSRAIVSKRLFGGNVGADLTYHLFRSLEPGARFWTAGVGLFVQWITGSSVPTGNGPDDTIEAGGFRAGAGLRLRF